MRVDLTLRALQAPDVAAAAADAEALGFDGVGLTESTGDPFIACALAATTTRRARIATGIALALPRTPTAVAYSAWDLQALSGGRFALGLGTQVRAHVERRFGVPWSRPAARMREFVLALRAIWTAWETGGELRFEGEFHRLSLMPAGFRPAPTGHPAPPVLLAAVRERMLEVSGEVADGVLLHALQSPEVLREVTLPAIGRGLERAGRAREDVEVVVGLFLATSDAEWEAIRRRVAFYGSTPGYRHVLDHHGLGALHEQLHPLSRAGDWAAMSRLVDDDVVALFGVRAAGREPADVAAEVLRRAAGADRVSLTGEQPDLTTWAQVAQAVRQAAASS
ncbi:TIGR03617 family F420-dependent LLM class oxidoreductase [Conexibacter sp. SYSU D00693]|uniref:TIGR03617 family F420-dependent LLM class oxidoreductase n=1 Tax=Conexibacter sp. SYSU D00693 TaxID=2812560 RepID=UPI00196B7979|nr:TIGR03617 family F420-dependent LLM class oxidoreductase [Conexibacter sp. SYSU D00693]